jgi:hypothetical protein
MTQKEFEASLQSGQEVKLRWRGVSCRAVIDKVNKASFAVRTSEAMNHLPAGTRLTVVRVVSGRWSASKCVRPADQQPA